MQSLPFRIGTDVSRRLVLITFEQVLWNLGVAERFRADCFAAVASLRCAPGQHLILVDLRNAVLQSKDVYAQMQALVGVATARRIALVASSPLARMQTKRLQIRTNVVMFAELAEAEEWLFEEDRAAA